MKLDKKSKNILGIAIGAIGFISSIIGIITVSVYLCVILAIISCILVFVFYFIVPQNNLPEGIEAIASEMENNSRSRNVKVIFPCDENYYKAANKLAREKFGKNSVSTKTVNDWKNRNELILSCLTDKNKMVGYFDILPLRKDFAEGLIKGKYDEKDIKAEHILSVHEMNKAEYIYFAGIAVEDTGSGKGCLHATYLIWAAILYVRIFYKDSNLKKILTIPTSELGLKVAEHLGFEMEREGRLRKDGFDIYTKDFEIKDLSNTIIKNANLYNRFDANNYLIAYKDLTGNNINLPINI